MGLRYRLAPVILGLVLLALLPAFCRPLIRAGETVRLLHGLRAGLQVAAEAEGGPAPAAMRRSVAFAVAGRAYRADLYLADPAPRAALLLVPGLAPEGKDDPRLVDLAVALAERHFAVLVPDIASLRAQLVGVDNIRQIADALLYLSGGDWSPETRDMPRGVAAISYAVGPTLLATLEPELDGRVQFLVGIGGYFDVRSVVAYFTTGYYRDDGDWRAGEPNVYGKWLFVAANAVHIRALRDRINVTAMAGRKLADPAADIADLVALLGPEGRAVHALLANADPDQTPALIDALPPGLRDGLLALDLSGRDLAAAPPRVILVHGRDDRIIPVGESIRLAAALPSDKADLYLVDNLSHADLRPGGWPDLWTLAAATYRILAIRDGAD